jgi:pimeloyl-ACP methyl ester carboxylesterase
MSIAASLISSSRNGMRKISEIGAPPSRSPTLDCQVNTFTRHLGRGPLHAVCLPGLVPDGPETFLRQIHLFTAFGCAELVTYPYRSFDLDALLHDVEDRLCAAAARGARPVLVGVSVGGGLALELLRRCRDGGRPLPLAGVILVSPLTCTADLAPLLQRYVDPIIAPQPGACPAQAVERARTFFRQLAFRGAGGASRLDWRTLLTPTGWIARQEAVIRGRIEATITAISVDGALDRVQALMHLSGLDGRPLTDAPTMVLWGSRERHTLRMDGPGTGVLCRPDLACRIFPEAEVQWVYGPEGDDVPHASLLKHAHAFNPHLKRHLRRLSGLRPGALAGLALALRG